MSAPLNIPSCTADQLFEARLKAGISRSALARLARVSVRSIYDFEMSDRQKKSKGLARAIAVLTAAGCDPRVEVAPVDPVKAARVVRMEAAKADTPKRAPRPEPVKAVVKARATAPKLAATVPVPATKAVPMPATKPVAPQPPKPVIANGARQPAAQPPLPAPIQTWNDDRAAIARAVLEAKKKWLARSGPRADTVLEYLSNVEIGLAPWDARRV